MIRGQNLYGIFLTKFSCFHCSLTLAQDYISDFSILLPIFHAFCISSFLQGLAVTSHQSEITELKCYRNSEYLEGALFISPYIMAEKGEVAMSSKWISSVNVILYRKHWKRSEVQHSVRQLGGSSKERGQQEDWTSKAAAAYSALIMDIKKKKLKAVN